MSLRELLDSRPVGEEELVRETFPRGAASEPERCLVTTGDGLVVPLLLLREVPPLPLAEPRRENLHDTSENLQQTQRNTYLLNPSVKDENLESEAEDDGDSVKGLVDDLAMPPVLLSSLNGAEPLNTRTRCPLMRGYSVASF